MFKFYVFIAVLNLQFLNSCGLVTQRRPRAFILFDGTWQREDQENPTNIAYLRNEIIKTSDLSISRTMEVPKRVKLVNPLFQRYKLDCHQNSETRDFLYYAPGIGTVSQTSKLFGGAFGWGIDSEIKSATFAMIDSCPNIGEYDIFVFGFSRGAFTARSFSGFLCQTDLNSITTWSQVEAEYKKYKSIDSKNFNPRREGYGETKIKFLGVWDTVGSLGLPSTKENMKYNYHKIDQISNVEYKYHALAINEKRSLFKPSLWPSELSNNKSEQRWFPGYHGDVGGGESSEFHIKNDPWANETSKLSLLWMSMNLNEVAGAEIIQLSKLGTRSPTIVIHSSDYSRSATVIEPRALLETSKDEKIDHRVEDSEVIEIVSGKREKLNVNPRWHSIITMYSNFQDGDLLDMINS